MTLESHSGISRQLSKTGKDALTRLGWDAIRNEQHKAHLAAFAPIERRAFGRNRAVQLRDWLKDVLPKDGENDSVNAYADSMSGAKQ